ncbi:MAG: type I 3-dehydroquinate dehydratase [Verrucomicrobiota bacterium]
MSQPPGKSIDPTSSLIVGIVTDPSSFEFATSGGCADFCHLLEVRLDAFKSVDVNFLKSLEVSGLPLLFTARDPLEGGLHDLSSDQREQLLLLALPFATLVDIEIRNMEKMNALVAKARRSNVSIVGSFHDFETFPSEAIQNVLRNDSGADIVKVAVHVESEEQLAELEAVFAARSSSLPIAIMGMGPKGRESRLRALRWGSVLNYGYLGKPNAPGQWSARELRTYLEGMTTG